MPQSLIRTFLMLTVFLHTSAHAASSVLGDWVVNAELSEAVQPEQPEQRSVLGNQNINTNVSVGGLPLPKIGVRQPPMSSETAKHPDVLQCQSMNITETVDGKHKRLELIYVGIGAETLVIGDYRGVKTKYNDKKIDSRYQTTERKVSKRYELRKDGRLEITVTIKPTDGSKRVYKQVFDRKSIEPS